MVVRRRLVAALAVTALSSAGFVAVTGRASADTGRNTLVQDCQAVSQVSLGHMMGACVGYFQSHEHAGVAAINQYFCTWEFVPEGQFATVGACVSALNQISGS